MTDRLNIAIIGGGIGGLSAALALTMRGIYVTVFEGAESARISELRKLFPPAAVHNTAVMLHSFYDGPGLLAAIHATAALGTADSMIEWRWFDLEAAIYGRAFKPKHGRISVPRGAGLGIDPDPEIIGKFRLRL